jgi:hypothetical protein
MENRLRHVRLLSQPSLHFFRIGKPEFQELPHDQEFIFLLGRIWRRIYFSQQSQRVKRLFSSSQHAKQLQIWAVLAQLPEHHAA